MMKDIAKSKKQEIEDIIKDLHMISALFMRCGERGNVKAAKKIINLLQKCKKKVRMPK